MKKHINKNSLSFRLLAGLLIIMIPINILLFGYTIYSRHTFDAEAHDTYSSYAQLVSKQLDHTLSNIRTYLMNIYYVNDFYTQMTHTSDTNDRYLAAMEIINEANNYLRIYPNPMMIFFRCENMSIPVASTYDSRNNSIHISQFIDDLPAYAQSFPTNEFFSVLLGDQYYTSIYYEKNGVFISALIELNALLGTLEYNGSSDIPTYLSDPRENNLTQYEKPPQKRFMHISVPLAQAPLQLVMEVPRDHMLHRLAALQTFNIIMLIVSLSGLCIYIILIRRQINQPLKRLMQTIKQIEGGALNTKISLSGTATEISEVYKTFNTFMDHIKDLKMQAYEEKLEKQQTQMQYLRLQLRPHFFLNSLKSVYALAEKDRIKEIQEYVVCLSEHFRFLIYDTTEKIHLKDELLHTQNYIQLQRIGYGLPIQCFVHMNHEMNQLEVPTLTIQTFVENSIKYASIAGQVLQITIHVSMMENENASYINLSIHDNGSGFPPEILQEMITDEEIFFARHKGLGNLKRRLKLMYTQEANIYLYNPPTGGATAEVLLPMQNTMTGERKTS